MAASFGSAVASPAVSPARSHAAAQTPPSAGVDHGVGTSPGPVRASSRRASLSPERATEPARGSSRYEFGHDGGASVAQPPPALNATAPEMGHGWRSPPGASAWDASSVQRPLYRSSERGYDRSFESRYGASVGTGRYGSRTPEPRRRETLTATLGASRLSVRGSMAGDNRIIKSLTIQLAEEAKGGEHVTPVEYLSPMEGETLVAVTVLEGATRKRFQWSRRRLGAPFVEIPAAGHSQRYVPTLDDVGCQLQCRLAVTGADGLVETSEVVTRQVIMGRPRIVQLAVEGGPVHTNQVVLQAKYRGGAEGKSLVQWSRCRPRGTFEPVVGATKSVYQPSFDDLDCHLRVTVTPVRSDGVVGEAASFDIPDDMLKLDPEVKLLIDQKVSYSGQAVFDVRFVDSPHNQEAARIMIDRKRVKATVAGKKLFSSRLHVGIQSVAVQDEPRQLLIRTGAELGARSYAFECDSHVARDVLALTLQSYIYMIKRKRALWRRG